MSIQLIYLTEASLHSLTSIWDEIPRPISKNLTHPRSTAQFRRRKWPSSGSVRKWSNAARAWSALSAWAAALWNISIRIWSISTVSRWTTPSRWFSLRNPIKLPSTVLESIICFSIRHCSLRTWVIWLYQYTSGCHPQTRIRLWTNSASSPLCTSQIRASRPQRRIQLSNRTPLLTHRIIIRAIRTSNSTMTTWSLYRSRLLLSTCHSSITMSLFKPSPTCHHYCLAAILISSPRWAWAQADAVATQDYSRSYNWERADTHLIGVTVVGVARAGHRTDWLVI